MAIKQYQANNYQGIKNKRTRSKSKPTISRSVDVKKFKYEGNTTEDFWQKDILNYINKMDISNYLKIKIKNDISKNFYDFMRSTMGKNTLNYTTYLSRKYPKLKKQLFKNMCQTLSNKNADKKRKEVSYDISGSGMSGKFCISGNKTLIKSNKPVMIATKKEGRFYESHEYSFELLISVTEKRKNNAK